MCHKYLSIIIFSQYQLLNVLYVTLQNLDALSAMNDTYPYRVPSVQDLPAYGVNTDNDILSVNNNFTSTFNLTFSLLRTLVSD